jgi:membrane-associated protease RseP (regulator of RpoE activity)
MLSQMGEVHPAIHATRSVAAQFTIDMLWGAFHMVIHEIGHILAAWMVGCKVKQVGFSRLGPYVRRTSAKTPWGNAFVALAGPGINILTSILFVVFSLPYAWIPMFIGVLNLLPVPNSDLSKSLHYLRASVSSTPQTEAPTYLD